MTKDKVTIKKQTLDDVVLVARNAIDKIIEMRKGREWVSLTKKEVFAISKINMDIIDMIYFVEAKVREKNHG